MIIVIGRNSRSVVLVASTPPGWALRKAMVASSAILTDSLLLGEIDGFLTLGFAIVTIVSAACHVMHVQRSEEADRLTSPG